MTIFKIQIKKTYAQLKIFKKYSFNFSYSKMCHLLSVAGD